MADTPQSGVITPPVPRTGSDAQRGVIALLSAADRVRTGFEPLFVAEGITGQQYNVLRILRGAGPEGLPTLSIADRMMERAPGITGLIDRLEAKGLVRRERGVEDRRCVYCRITDIGLALLARLDKPVDRADHATFAAISPDELRELTALLDRVGVAPTA